MTTNTLPEEVLLMIFNHANDKNEAKIYQRVCRAWYQPAHTTFLQTVNIRNYTQVEQFIRSIDCNPNPLYLKAVKKITISSVDHTLGNTNLVTLFGQAMIKKLFFRFPNLEHVSLSGSFHIFRNFSDELCQEFLYNCPKLVTFEVGFTRVEYMYLGAIQRARLLMTSLDMSVSYSLCNTSVITSLPRLNSIKGDFNSIPNFEKLLPIVEMTPSLKRIWLNNNLKDGERFAENYLSWKPKQEQDRIVEKLTEIKSLNWNTGRFNSPINSLKFIVKYLTGLDQLEIFIKLQEPWEDQQQRRFCSTALELIRSKRNSYLDLHVYGDHSYRYLAFALTQIKIQVLQLSLGYRDDLEHTMRIESDKQEFMNILNSYIPSPYLFSATTPLASINEFILKIRYKTLKSLTPYLEDYPRMFQGMPSLKKATLDVPIKLPEERERKRKTWYKKPEGFTLEEIPSSYMDQKPLCLELHSLTIRATPFGETQSLLKRCPYMFPNLNNLDIHYYCGVWDESIGNFQLALGRYSLEKLAVDVTPVKMILKKKFKKDQFTKSDFFVVAVELLNGEERHLYKVSMNLSSVTEISGNDLKGFTRSIDYLCVSVIISSLKQLELVTYRYGTPKEIDEDYLNVGKCTTYIVL